jgi:hypothetical protein
MHAQTRIDRHAFKNAFIGAPDCNEVASVIFGCEGLQLRHEFVQPGMVARRKVMQMAMDALSDIVAISSMLRIGALYALLESLSDLAIQNLHALQPYLAGTLDATWLVELEFI